MSKKTDQTLKKCDELIERLNSLKKALNAPNVSSRRTPANALGVGWSQDPSTGSFHHSMHGVISTTKHPEGYYQITHGGRSVGRAATPADAGSKIKSYVKTLHPRDTGMHDVDPMAVGKEDTEKSDYGKFKGGSQYQPEANVRRKMHNVGAERFGNQSIKSYTRRAFEHKVPKGAAGPVKQYTSEQIAAINEANKLKKTAESSPWTNHAGIPNADQEVQKLQQANSVSSGEDAMAAQLANLMRSKAMMAQKPPTTEEMIKAGERMFGVTEEALGKQEQQWGGAINSWLVEASKPISSRFASEEEEMAYWNSIKVADRDDGKPGF